MRTICVGWGSPVRTEETPEAMTSQHKHHGGQDKESGAAFELTFPGLMFFNA